jgi:hypothetical protein
MLILDKLLMSVDYLRCMNAEMALLAFSSFMDTSSLLSTQFPVRKDSTKIDI